MLEIAEVRACVSGREVLDGGTGSERDERSFVKVAATFNAIVAVTALDNTGFQLSSHLLAMHCDLSGDLQESVKECLGGQETQNVATGVTDESGQGQLMLTVIALR